jgi:flagellar hook-associated protein 1 FlgK
MSNLLSSLVSSANTLAAYDQVLAVTQNNVANASTPGYAKQRQTLVAMPFDPADGLNGGVLAGEVQSMRDEYAENSVRSQTLQLGAAQQNVTSFSALQGVFDISGDSGIPQALNNLCDAFSAWAQSPADTVARQTVINQATDLAAAFQQTATGLNKVAQSTEEQIQQTVDMVNGLTGQLRDLNAKIMNNSGQNAGLDAQVNATLEELSQYVDITSLPQADGTVTVLMNGQTPLVMADRQYTLSTDLTEPDTPPPTYADARPLARVQASDGSDITGATTGGTLGALLDFRNRVLPSYLGSAYQQGDLNTMAQQIADRVNQLLTSGEVTDGTNPVNGSALFTYDTANGTNAAQSLAVDPTITTDQLAAIDPGPPEVANGIPMALSGLADPQSAADEVNGASYSQFFGLMAARAGNGLNDAQSAVTVQQSAVAQAKQLRDQMSGVSLDEEAMILLQFQRGYEANSKLISVLSQLTEDLIQILQ